jgi:hypothetical protein
MTGGRQPSEWWRDPALRRHIRDSWSGRPPQAQPPRRPSPLHPGWWVGAVLVVAIMFFVGYFVGTGNPDAGKSVPTASAPALPSIFPAKLPLSDPLKASRHAQGWSTDPYCGFKNDSYHVSVLGKMNIGNFCDNKMLVVGNADISVDVTLIARVAPAFNMTYDRGLGIGIRRYVDVTFGIRPDGTWIVNPGASLREFDSLKAEHSAGMEGVSSLVKRGVGVTNRLRLVTRGTTVEFFINGGRLGYIDLDTYRNPVGGSNSIVFFADIYDDAAFSNLVVNPL